MHILICPAAFKESFTASAVAAAMAEGARRAAPGATVELHPVSDGGSDLVDVLLATAGGEVETCAVTGPFGDPVDARILWLSATQAVIGTADVCGLDLVPAGRRDPGITTTRGVGELLDVCAERSARSIHLGLGGSGTVDGGTGMAAALGFRFIDDDGRDLPRGGAGLIRLASISRPPERPLPGITCTALADVRSPLLGPDGAARRFGPQKGADAELVDRLESGIARLRTRWITDLGVDPGELEGAGAAGGLGAGCVAFLGAALESGASWFADRTGLRARCAAADLVITGEGALDVGSRLGKAPWHVAGLAAGCGTDCLYVAARIEVAPPGAAVGVAGDGAWLDGPALAALVERAVRGFVA